jgi:transposase, IS5 family
MRDVYHAQLPLAASRGNHPRADELAEMSRALDANRSALRAVHVDLLRIRNADATQGRKGMSAEQVVRAAVVKQMFGLSYEQLAFQLGDSLQVRGFCRLSPADDAPGKSALQANIGAVRAETWEAMNKTLVKHARQCKVEDGRWMRTDTTVVESNIHHPLDSSLLWDGVRVLTRIMQRAHDKYGTTRSNFRKRAKRRMVAILNAGRMDRRVRLYKDLLKVTRKTVSAAEKAFEELTRAGALVYATKLGHFLPLVKRVIDQTERRVLREESVPADEKLVSIFEPHTDIIRKDRRDTYFGHKVTLSTGHSGMVVDLVIEEGNPADSTLTLRSAKRHKKLFGVAPERVAFDGGFASKANHEALKASGTAEVCFSKPAGVPVEEMTSTPRIRRILKRFRAGIEATVSFLKRSFGLSRCTWKGMERFRAYAWCSTVAHNLLVLARSLLRRPTAT